MPTIGYVYLAEVLPREVRGAWVSGGGILVATSASVASVVGFDLLPSGDWRAMFAIPAGAGLVLIALCRTIPESPRWLAGLGRRGESDDAVLKISPRIEIGPDHWDMGTMAPQAASCPMARIPPSLHRAPTAQRLLLATGLAVAANVTSNGVIAWLPTVLVERASVNGGLGMNLVIMLGAPVGSLIGYVTIGRFGRKPAIATSSTVAAALAAGCAYVDCDTGLVGLAFALMAAINLVCTIILGVYVPELFPTSIRARGASFALTASRVALIAAPFATGTLEATPLIFVWVAPDRVATSSSLV